MNDDVLVSESEQIATDLLMVAPLLNRILSYELNKIEQDETTIVQIRVLTHLVEKPITMSELAKRRRVSLQASSEHVNGLVERGWVRKVADENDRRRFLLHITEAGHKQLKDAKYQLVTALIPTLDKLSIGEKQQISETLASLKWVLTQHSID